MMSATAFECFYAGRMMALAEAEARKRKLPPVNEAPQQRLSIASVTEAAQEGASLATIARRHGVTHGTLVSFMHRNGLRLKDLREDGHE